MKQTLQTVTDTAATTPTRYKWKGNSKQKLAMDNWINPTSKTFGNAYQSFLEAGFSPSYARNVLSLTPKWLSEYIERIDFKPEHIKQGIQQIAVAAPDSKSPDDTRLKAYELLGKIAGLIDTKNGPVTVNVVQPILGGTTQQTAANTPTKVEAKVTVKQTEDKEEQTLADKLID